MKINKWILILISVAGIITLSSQPPIISRAEKPHVHFFPLKENKSTGYKNLVDSIQMFSNKLDSARSVNTKCIKKVKVLEKNLNKANKEIDTLILNLH